MLGSIGAGALSSPAGILSEDESTRLALCETVTLVLWNFAISNSFQELVRTDANTYRLMSPGWVLPVMSLSQASAHSRTTSMAYFLFLHSPEKANWFSGLPSGIL